MRELVPTVPVSRGSGPVAALPRAERSDLDAVTFVPIGATTPMTWAAAFDANYTDGILVLHRGRVVYERYAGALVPERQHIAFSVTKSFVATLAGILIAEGMLDGHATVGQLSAGAAAERLRRRHRAPPARHDHGARLQRGLRRRRFAGVESGAGSRLPAGAARVSAAGDDLCLPGLARRSSEHGERFSYKTPNTDALAWVMRKVTGRPLAELLRDRLFARLGAEQDAYFLVDPVGVEFAGGGLHLSLRDLARFGELMRLGGRFNGAQVVPKAFVDDMMRGGDRARFAGAGYKMLPGWSYRSMWWVSHNDHGAFAARGIHGQAIYVDPAAEMVIARFALAPAGCQCQHGSHVAARLRCDGATAD
jgi:CubicO group peptidase (beta-lactamase class C family)